MDNDAFMRLRGAFFSALLTTDNCSATHPNWKRKPLLSQFGCKSRQTACIPILEEVAMKDLAFSLGDSRKRAVADTVGSILENKGHDVVSISPTATVYDAIAEMARRQVGALVVLAGGRLVGIVSERDYARKVILQGRSSKETQVQQIMTPCPITVAPP